MPRIAAFVKIFGILVYKIEDTTTIHESHFPMFWQVWIPFLRLFFWCEIIHIYVSLYTVNASIYLYATMKSYTLVCLKWGSQYKAGHRIIGLSTIQAFWFFSPKIILRVLSHTALFGKTPLFDAVFWSTSGSSVSPFYSHSFQIHS